MTANAFMSVSLEPPLVLISVDRNTKMCGMLHEGSHYGVSVLCESQAALSDRFAGRPCDDCPNPQFDLVRETPLVDGALAHFVARVERSYWGGDHSLFLGRVEYARTGSGTPLLFHGGRYASVGNSDSQQACGRRPVPEHREERLVHRQVAAAPVARVDLVDVGRVEAGVGGDQVGDDRAAVARRLVGSRAVEGQRVVERAAARLDHDRHQLGLDALGCGAAHRREPVLGRVEAAAVGRDLGPAVRPAGVLDRAALGARVVERHPAGDHLRRARGSRRTTRPGASRASARRAASRGSCPGACARRRSPSAARRCAPCARSAPARRSGRRRASRCRSGGSGPRSRGRASS